MTLFPRENTLAIVSIILTGSRQKERGKEEGEVIVVTPATPSLGKEVPRCCNLCCVELWALALSLEQTVARTCLASLGECNKLGLLYACY